MFLQRKGPRTPVKISEAASRSRNWSRLSWAGVILLAGATLSTAQTIAPARIGIVNAQKAVADTQEIKRDQATLETKYHPRQQAIANLQHDLQTIQQQLTAPNVSPQQEAQLRQNGTEKQKELQRLSEDLQFDVNAERQDILGRAGRQMSQVIKQLAEHHSLDMIVDVTNTLYYKPALDLTAEATAAYDKAYPPR